MNHLNIATRRVPPELAMSNILVVDDSRTHRKLVESSLRQAGFTRITTAADGQQALDMVHADPPDLMLLDIVMPVLDGFGVCEALRADLKYADLPILVMTSLESVEHRLRALAVGATDVILKPVYQPQLVGHTVSHLERRQLVLGLLEYQERTVAELAMARLMQEALLPDEKTISDIQDRYGIEISALFEPCAELGGDLWGLWAIDASRIGVFVGDVAGHGTIAAINTFRIHTLLTRSDFDRSDPGRFLSSVNDYLAALLSPGQYVTMVYAVLDMRLDCIGYAAAGSPEPILAAKSGAPIGLDGSGVPLGIVAGIQYPTRTCQFLPGSKIVFHSDALTEARLRTDDTLLGEDQARKLVAETLKDGALDKVASKLHARVRALTSERLEDDLTLICISRPDIDLGLVSGSVAMDLNAIDGRILAVASALSQRLMVKRAGLHAGLTTDLASDLATAGRFLAANSYVAIVIDLRLPIDERLELLRVAASVPNRPRLILAGTSLDEMGGVAASLGLEVAARLSLPLEIPATATALLASVSRKGNSGRTDPCVVITSADLRSALANNEVTFSFQPQVTLATRRVTGAEALARWISPRHGIIPPGMLSTVEDRTTACLLADATLRAATSACATWRINTPRMRVAVNLSAAALADASLPGLVGIRLSEAGIPPSALIVEVAEADAASCLSALSALSELGVCVALDEFGLGNIGLQAIERLPVGMLKLSRSVIRNCEADQRAIRMINITVAVARALGLTVGAVGVEDYAVEQTLRSAGCDIAQGWLYGPALSSQAISAMLCV